MGNWELEEKDGIFLFFLTKATVQKGSPNTYTTYKKTTHMSFFQKKNNISISKFI